VVPPVSLALTALEALSLMLLGGTTQTEAHPTILDLAIASESVVLALAIGGISERLRRPKKVQIEFVEVTFEELIERIGFAPLARPDASVSSDAWAELSSLGLSSSRSRAAAPPRWRALISEAAQRRSSPSPTVGRAAR
jgi:hypothetical protein